MKKAIIIGAGPAGLTAAYELLDRSGDYEVVVLEESEHMGGICKTVEYKGTDLLARAFCHELDHLDGKLYVDIAEDVEEY